MGTLSGTTTVPTDAQGRADFSNLEIIGNDGSYLLQFTSPGLPPVNSSPVVLATPSSAPVLVGAGDIADCVNPGDTGTAALLDSIPGTVFAAGDNAYENGSATQYANCYDPTWGRHKARTRPAPGNHEYHTAFAAPYYAYFGANAGPAGLGYYSYDLGSWHIISLNSVKPDTVGSAQHQWLQADLAADTSRCTLAYFHHARFTSGGHGDNPVSQPLWQDLYAAGVDVIISGHAHVYERFAPQSPAGVADPARGIREFVAGTGGKSHGILNRMGIHANSQVFDNTTFGVLKLTLRPGGYDWRFVPVAGGTFTDSGTDSCH
jgi:hypothetical protein